jgi:hypothetical protein
MGFVISLIVIAVGAILTWAVHRHSGSVNINTVGIILMIVGGVGFLLSLFFWESVWGPGYFRRGGYAQQAGGYSRPWYYGPRRRGSYVVEEEEVPPGPPPPY